MDRARQWYVLLAATLALAVVSGCGSASTSSASSPPSASPAVESIAPSEGPSAPSPSVVAAATLPVDWTTYQSMHRGYRVDYPSDWTLAPAEQDWPADGFSFPEDWAIDKWAPPKNTSTWVLMFVSSVPLEKGEKPAQRMARLNRDNAMVCSLANRRIVTLDGVTAQEEDGTCFGTDFIDEVVTVNNGRFFLLYVLSGGALSDVTLATFDHFAKSFRFIDS